MQEKENVSANTVSTIDPEEPKLELKYVASLSSNFAGSVFLRNSYSKGYSVFIWPC